MRLYNIYYLCNIAVTTMNNVTMETLKKDAGICRIYGWHDALESMAVLRNLSFLSDDINAVIETMPLYARDKETPEISRDIYNKLGKNIKTLTLKLETVVDLYESIENGESQEGIDIKIPKCNSLKEYIQYMKDIDFVLSQCPFISKCDEEIVFNTVDVGSMWISLAVKASVAKHLILNTISKMVELAIKVKSNNIVIKQQNEMLEAMKQKNEVGQEVLDAFKMMKTKILDDIVSEMEQDSGMQIDSPEDRDRAGRSIERLSELIEKGVEIYSAIETPNEIKVLFPFTDDSPTIPDNLMKFIEDKEGEE